MIYFGRQKFMQEFYDSRKHLLDFVFPWDPLQKFFFSAKNAVCQSLCEMSIIVKTFVR